VQHALLLIKHVMVVHQKIRSNKEKANRIVKFESAVMKK
jgi:hypothetical protein